MELGIKDNPKLRLFIIINCAGSTYLHGRNEKLKSCLFEILDNISQKGKTQNFELVHTVIILGDSGIREIVGFNNYKSLDEANFEAFGIMSLSKALDEIKNMWKSPMYLHGEAVAAILLLSDGVFDFESESAIEKFNSLTEFKHIPKIVVCSDVINNSDEYQNLSKFAGDKIYNTDVLSVQKISQEIIDSFFDNNNKDATDEPKVDSDFDLDLL